VEAGLVHVYLGVESGDSQHLEDLGKNTTAERHLEAARTLTELGVGFDFGYMLLTPWSTFDTLRSNLAFVEEISSGGLAAAGFCRTLPYAGTSIADRLQTEGRLLPGCHADYLFNDPRLDSLWEWMYRTLNHRNQDPEGTRNLLSILLFESIVELPGHPRNDGHLARLRSLARCSNELMFDVVESAVDHVADHDKPLPQDDEYLVWLTGFHRTHDARIRTELEWICRMRAHDNASDLSGACHDTQAPGPTVLGA